MIHSRQVDDWGMPGAMLELCKKYDPRSFPPVAVTVDLVVLTIRNSRLCALTICRGDEPFKGRWACPEGS